MGGSLGYPGGAWFNPIARVLGPRYWAPDTGRVMAFTKGTEQEVDFLVDALGLDRTTKVLDVGCGPGRHSLALARRGIPVHGVDLSPDFVALARDSAERDGLAATFEIADVRDLEIDGEYAAVICLCQGGFGLLGGRDDAAVFGRIARAVQAGGTLAISAFSSYFALRWQEPGEDFDPATGLVHEIVTLRDEAGTDRPFDLWTTCFTARELALLGAASGLAVDGVHGVAPGRYARSPVTLQDPELLLVAHRPAVL